MNSDNDLGVRFAARISKQKRILIIDDERDVTFTLRMVLEHNGFKTDSYTNPELAYESFKDMIQVLTPFSTYQKSSYITYWYEEQMVSANSKQVGCGTAFSRSLDYSILVCRYDPPGNYQGQLPYPGAAPPSRAVADEEQANTESGALPIEQGAAPSAESGGGGGNTSGGGGGGG